MTCQRQLRQSVTDLTTEAISDLISSGSKTLLNQFIQMANSSQVVQSHLSGQEELIFIKNDFKKGMQVQVLPFKYDSLAQTQQLFLQLPSSPASVVKKKKIKMLLFCFFCICLNFVLSQQVSRAVQCEYHHAEITRLSHCIKPSDTQFFCGNFKCK